MPTKIYNKTNTRKPFDMEDYEHPRGIEMLFSTRQLGWEYDPDNPTRSDVVVLRQDFNGVLREIARVEEKQGSWRAIYSAEPETWGTRRDMMIAVERAIIRNRQLARMEQP